MFNIFRWFKESKEDIDLRIAELGFRKTLDSDMFLEYMRYNNDCRYTQLVEICRKKGTVSSYSIEGTTSTGSPVVALTIEEAELFLKKAKESYNGEMAERV